MTAQVAREIDQEKARSFPSSRFVGYDFSEQAISAARAEAASWG